MNNNQLADNNSFLGFTDNRTALQAGKIEKCLSKAFRYDGVVMERRDAMLRDLRNGGEPKISEEAVNGKTKKSYRIYSTIKDGEFAGARVFSEITKTEYDFCMYLIKNDLISEERVNSYLEEEKNKRTKAAKTEREAEEAARREKEKQEEEKENFKSWVRSAAETYIGTSKGNLMEKIFVDKLGEFKYPIGAFALLVCIDNIENNPLCREELKERLYTGNVASRKTFECVTGLKLPKNNRDTQEFIDNLKKSDYREMTEYKVRKKSDKTEESKPEDAEKEEFYILEFDPTDENRKPEYRKIMAERIEKKGFECFIHETEDGKIAISSAECGMRLSVGSTKAEAIRELKRTINKVGDVTLRKNIRMAIERFGKSPYEAA